MQACGCPCHAEVQDLAKRGATLVQGDATKADDLHRAFKVSTAFSSFSIVQH